MSKIIILYTLKPGITREIFENWTRTTDYPTMRGVSRVSSFANYRVERPMMGDAKPSVDYVEVFDIPDLEGFMSEDLGGNVVQRIMGEFVQHVENPEFLIAEEIV